MAERLRRTCSQLTGRQVEDHNPPLLGQIFAFLERAGLFAAEDPENIIAVCVRANAEAVLCLHFRGAVDSVGALCRERHLMAGGQPNISITSIKP